MGIFNVSSIHSLLFAQKCEISTVDCIQIKDLNNLCVRPTIACKQAKLGLDSLRSRWRIGEYQSLSARR